MGNRSLLDFILDKIFKDDEKLEVLEDEFHGRELIETFSLLVAAVLFIIYLIFGDIF